MKIAILIDELISGGFQKVAIMEAKYLNELGHEAVLVVLHRIKDEGYRDLIEKSQVKVVTLSDRLPFWLKINFRFPFFSFFSFFHIFYPIFIWRYVKKDHFDYLIAHGTYTSFSAIAIHRKLQIPFASFIHDSVTYIIENKYQQKFLVPFYRFCIWIARKIDRRIIQASDFVFAFPDMITEMKKVVPEYLGYRAVYNGCEILSESDLCFEKSHFAISVTKWDQGKNFDFLLHLWKNLDKKIPLKIIGSFHPVDLQSEMQKKIQEENLEDVIELIGSVTEEELSSYYKQAKFLIHPCREAFGMTILEASGHGCPAIFTNNSGVAALYSNEILTLLPSENDFDKYQIAIQHVLELTKDFYTDLVRFFYRSAKENSWINHCSYIINQIEQKKYEKN